MDLAQELILDHWELYPDWYRKQDVTVKASDGKEHEAIIYTVDYDGPKLDHFARVVNDLPGVISNARAARKRVMKKFPEAFRELSH
jgi:hypothetical protein